MHRYHSCGITASECYMRKMNPTNNGPDRFLPFGPTAPRAVANPTTYYTLLWQSLRGFPRVKKNTHFYMEKYKTNRRTTSRMQKIFPENQRRQKNARWEQWERAALTTSVRH